MSPAQLSSPPATRLSVAAAVGALHVIAAIGLIHAFAPGLTAKLPGEAPPLVTVTVVAPEREVPPPERAAPDRGGAASPPGKRASPAETPAQRPAMVLATPTPAPPRAGKGHEAAGGATMAGDGTGASGQGQGLGAGQGEGRGGSAAKPVKIAGDINAARDYPKASRALRLGDHVVVALTVGTDGRVKSCRIHRASRDPEADRTTCRLASERFRFRPATDAGGNPVEAVYGWQQRWYAPREKD